MLAVCTMKLRIRESINLMSSEIYENIAILGYMCALASNDLHHIHLCAKGDKFQEIHKDAEDYMDRVRELGDFCLELAKENDCEIANETFALNALKEIGIDWNVETSNSYYFIEAYEAITRILTDVCQKIASIQKMNTISSDVSSELDTYLREFTKDINYFINKKLS